MKLLFLGTRGEIEKKTRRHHRHSSLLVSEGDTRLVIDCGADWLGRVAQSKPDAILLTYAHRDHVYGLSRGSPSPVYATRETWQRISSYPIIGGRLIKERIPIEIGPLRLEAFPVEHSLRPPAVGYRINAGKHTFFYASDVVDIGERNAALSGIDLYIGDGATVSRPILRRRGSVLIGHVSIRTQLDWCHEARVPSAIFTHCGSQIVGGDERVLSALIRRLGRERNVSARLAYDGMIVEFDQGVKMDGSMGKPAPDLDQGAGHCDRR